MVTHGLLVFAVLLASGACATTAVDRTVIKLGDVVVCDGALPVAAATDAAVDPPGCSRREVQDIDPQGRVLWVRVGVWISDEDDAARAPLGVFVAAMASSEVFWNGQRLGANGVPGASRDAESPGLLDADFPVPPSVVHPGRNVLAVKLASFHNPLPVRAPVHWIFVATYHRALGWLASFYAPALMTAGALLLVAIYFAARFAGDRRDRDSLLVALMAGFSIVQLAAEAWRAFATFPYPLQVPRLIVIVLCSAGFALCVAAHVARRFAPERWRRHLAVAGALTAIVAPLGPGFDAKALLGTLVPIAVALAVVVPAAWRGGSGARPVVIVLAGFLALVVVDPELFLDRTFYLATTGLAFALAIHQAGALRRARAAEDVARERAVRLELELVKRRIVPHFLMNTLNALIDWVESEPRIGVKMIEALAGEFQLLSQMSDRALVALADEIALCERHLEVMSYRVDRAFSLAVDGVDRTLAIPPGVLHTLIENAFTHGRFNDGAAFHLCQTQDDRGVVLALRTPAVSGPGAGRGHGEGITYVRARLDAAFGDGATLSDGPDRGGWLTVITLPRLAGLPRGAQ